MKLSLRQRLPILDRRLLVPCIHQHLHLMFAKRIFRRRHRRLILLSKCPLYRYMRNKLFHQGIHLYLNRRLSQYLLLALRRLERKFLENSWGSLRMKLREHNIVILAQL
jgi:hypothetical protein